VREIAFVSKATLLNLQVQNNDTAIASGTTVGIPMKVVSDSDLIPVAGSEVQPGVFGAKRRWRSYGA
jgi:hypothetical protein